MYIFQRLEPLPFLKLTAMVGIHGRRCSGEPRSSCHIGRHRGSGIHHIRLLEPLEFKREILLAQ